MVLVTAAATSGCCARVGARCRCRAATSRGSSGACCPAHADLGRRVRPRGPRPHARRARDTRAVCSGLGFGALAAALPRAPARRSQRPRRADGAFQDRRHRGVLRGQLLRQVPPFPRLSPGKTTAGCVGSFAAGTLAGLCCRPVEPCRARPRRACRGSGGALAGALINIAAQAGDLYESHWKRRTGVKDSGTWFGPSGGVLDLVDSLLFTAPVAAITWPALFGWSA
ncbi:MAG: phosphatidate cytidylyltransferase [Planctomycetota bacterium]